MRLKKIKPLKHRMSLRHLPNKKLLITTINAHSYNVSRKDADFAKALAKSDVLIADGIGVVWSIRFLQGRQVQRIAGADLFKFEMKRLNNIGGTCFFLGSSESTLKKIHKRAAIEFPNVRIETYSPPYKPKFSDEDNRKMIEAVNAVKPDVLFIGMTAPKQEKWALNYMDQLDAKHIGCIGAVFDFYAGNINRAPKWMQESGLEWFHRFSSEPKRLWKRYLVGNALFFSHVIEESFKPDKRKTE